jgi:hypothetical protein
MKVARSAPAKNEKCMQHIDEGDKFGNKMGR